ncbi:MAG: hypothetical protein VX739_04995 [Planctomycetota bacterium]|nr:hypothetical protein [Planctomycetota bacterium]
MGNPYFNRYLFYSGLLLLGGMMLIDAMPQYTRLHGRAKQWVDPLLDVTGLWQGSWELFAPTPDYVNIKILAIIQWNDGTETVWGQPDWHAMSPWQKMRAFRQMSYYDNLWRDSYMPAWSPFCERVAEMESAGSSQTPEVVRLYYVKDEIAPPHREWRPAYSAPKFDAAQEAPNLLYRWTPSNHDGR